MKKYLFLGGLVLAPSMAFAAEGVAGVLEKVSGIVALIVPLILSLAVVFFLWNLAMYMTKSGEDKDEAKDKMIMGIIVLFVMVSIWGLVSLLQETIGVEDTDINITNPLDVIQAL